MVAKQQTELEAHIAEYQSTNAAREQMEHELEETENKYKASMDRLMEAERKGLLCMIIRVR